jgi:hypothetical protein
MDGSRNAVSTDQAGRIRQVDNNRGRFFSKAKNLDG